MFALLKKHLVLAIISFVVPVIAVIALLLVVCLAAALSPVSNSEDAGTPPTSSPSGSTASSPGNVSGLPISNNLVAFLESWEGYSATPYNGLDSWNTTIGYGHVITKGESYTYLSTADAEALLVKDLKEGGYCESVKKAFTGVNLSQNQFDALVSLAFNIGGNSWSNLSLTKDIKAGASADVITADFQKINHVGTAFSQGLYNRRTAEALMYTQNIYQLNK